MKKVILFFTLLILFISCSNDDDNNNEESICATINCEPGAPLKLIFSKNDQNTFVAEENVEINITNNGQIFETINFGEQLDFFVVESPYVIVVGEEEFSLEFTVVSEQGECCIISKVTSVLVNDTVMCNGLEACNGSAIEISI